MIYGERVRLRDVERDDLPRYVEWLNDPEVRRGLNVVFPLSSAEEEAWFEGVLDRPEAERPFAIDALEGERWVHIGGCGLFDLQQRDRRAELGIMIGDKSRWDQGYGTDSMQVLLRHGFETLNLHRIKLRVFEFNERAIKVYRRLGFVEEGRLRQESYQAGRYWDTLVMGLLRSEWEAEVGKEG